MPLRKLRQHFPKGSPIGSLVKYIATSSLPGDMIRVESGGVTVYFKVITGEQYDRLNVTVEDLDL